MHVQLPGVVLDRPGGEGVAETVGIGVDAGPDPQALEERPQEGRVHRTPRLRPPRDGEEQGSGDRAAEAVDVVPQGAGGPGALRDYALFALWRPKTLSGVRRPIGRRDASRRG